MRKMILLAAVAAIAALMLAAAPAMADDNDRDGRDDVTFRFVGDDDFCDFFDCDDDDDFCDIFDCNDDDFCDIFDCNNDFVPVVTQDFDQEAESGDVSQSFDVSNTGDNSNQTVGIQGVANTGNAQNQIGVIDAGDFADFNNNDDFCDFFDCRDHDNDFFDFGDDNNGDFEFDNVGSTIEVSPSNVTTSDQQVNQAAAASAPHHWVWTASGWMWV